LKRGIPAQFMSATGFLLFFIFCWMLYSSNLNSGTSDFFWPLIIRGVGMALLFVPLTTLAIADLRGPEIGQGTGLNNMGRQLGGSFGIAIITTIIHIKSGINRSVLLENINQYNPAYMARYNQMVNTFLSSGASPEQAQRMAYGAIEGVITRQTMLTTFNDVYLLVGFFVLLCIPLIFLQKFKKGKPSMPVDAH
jgi:DHA2 family multidrug resistance protein